MSDEVRRFSPLDVKEPILCLSVLRPSALVPRDGLPDRYEQPTAGIHPVAKFDVLHAPPRERLVAAAHFPVEMPADPKVAPSHHPKQIIGLRRQVAGSRQVSCYPRWIRPPTEKQFLERPWTRSDRLRVNALHCYIVAQSDSQGVRDGMVPAGMHLDPSRLRQRVAVEKEEDIPCGCSSAGVPRPGKPERPTLLAHDLDIQQGRSGPFQRRVRPVVGKDHFEQITRIGLAFECRQGPRQRLGRRLVGWDDYADRQCRRERLWRRHRDLTPVVVRNTGRFWTLRAIFPPIYHQVASSPGYGGTGSSMPAISGFQPRQMRSASTRNW